ncbi:MAG: hypothetical protein HY617_00720 [Candidatus Sungbacteria bacterium]|nr:hypothetical protein [Candidatus Sungbacteria bacterium]
MGDSIRTITELPPHNDKYTAFCSVCYATFTSGMEEIATERARECAQKGFSDGIFAPGSERMVSLGCCAGEVCVLLPVVVITHIYERKTHALSYLVEGNRFGSPGRWILPAHEIL